MAWKEDEIEETFNYIIGKIKQGNSLRSVLREKGTPESHTFYKWIDNDESKLLHYVRACKDRADYIFEDILNICDKTDDDIIVDEDGNEITNHNVIQRDRLRVDSRKWMLGKMNPKKYGDASLLKIGDQDGNELKVNAIFSNDIMNVPADNSTKEDS